MKIVVEGFDVPRWVIVAFVACWSPAIVLVALGLLPVYALAVAGCNLYNLARAAHFNPRRFLKLCQAVFAHVSYVVLLLPRMVHIAVYYYLLSPRDGVRKHIPYAITRTTVTTADKSDSSAFHHHNVTTGGEGSVQYLLADVYFHTAAAARTHAATPTNATAVAQSQRAPSPTGGDDSPLSAGTTSSSSSSCDVTGTSTKPRCGLAPVVIFVYGGAWGSGQRWYYAHLAASLRAATGAVVVVPEYSTYPTGDMSAMVSDIHNAVMWTQSNVARFGGDANDITLMGHSAGAHLVSLYLLRYAMHLAKVDVATAELLPELGSKEPIPILHPWLTTGHQYPQPQSVDLATLFGDAVQARRTRLGRSSQQLPVARAVLLSGVYDLPAHFEFERRRAVEEVSPMRPATAGRWYEHSPTHLLRTLSSQDRTAVLSRLPFIAVLHSAIDLTVDASQSREFAEACGQNFDATGAAALAGGSGTLPGVDHGSIVMNVRYRWASTAASDHATLQAVQATMSRPPRN